MGGTYNSQAKSIVVHTSANSQMATNQAKRVCIREVVVEDVDAWAPISSASQIIVSALPTNCSTITYPFPHRYGDSREVHSENRDAPLISVDEMDEDVEELDHGRALEVEVSISERGSDCSDESEENLSTDEDEESEDEGDSDSSSSKSDEDGVPASTLLQMASHGDVSSATPIGTSQHVVPSDEALLPHTSITEPISSSDVISPPVASTSS